jgi:uncharacterized protein with PQ loop repeat
MFVCQIPQVLTLLKSKSAEGVSFSLFYLEMLV